MALRTGLFRSPETLSTLRSEAADRFLRWREVERAVDEIHSVRRGREDELQQECGDNIRRKWSKGHWEAEWEAGLSRDVAQRLREDTVVQDELHGRNASHVMWAGGVDFDPLHIPSLFMFSLSLLGPLSSQLVRSVEEVTSKMQLRAYHLGLALVSGFFVGVGFGMLVR